MIVMKASAGSGKTYNLTLHFISRLVLEGKNAFLKILAVTFTQDATAEMKLRILSDLYAIANDRDPQLVTNIISMVQKQGKRVEEQEVRTIVKEALFAILHNYGSFNVGTIDSFFQRVLRNLARELGKGSRFNIELNTTKVIDNAVEQLIVKSHHDKELLRWLQKFITDKIDSDKSWNIENDLKRFGTQIFNEYYQKNQKQLADVTTRDPKIFEKKIKECREIQAIFENYLKRQADKFERLCEQKGLSEAIFYRKYLPNYFKKFKNNDFDFENTKSVEGFKDSPETMVVKSTTAGDLSMVKSDVHRLFLETENYRQKNMENYISAKIYIANIYQLGIINAISKEIELQSRETNRFILQDTTMLLSAMIKDQDFSFVYEKIGAEIQNVMIDEFQDTSFLQWENFRALLSDIIASGRFSLLVGDVKQSIYRWRNSDWEILNNIEKNIDGRIEIETLNDNWRSGKNVVEFNNKVFAEVSNKIASTLFDKAKENPFTKAYSDVCQQPKRDNLKGYVRVEFIDSDGEGSSKTIFVDKAKERLWATLQQLADKGYPATDICILCRKNREIEDISQFLASKPIEGNDEYKNIISTDAFSFGSSSLVRLIVAGLHLVYNPQNGIAREAFDTLCESLQVDDKQRENYFVSNKLKTSSIYAMVLGIVKHFSLEDTRFAHQSGYMYAFVESVMAYQRDVSSNLSHFLKYWEEELSAKSVGGSSAKGIRIMTIHKSKGLEFGTVIIPFVSGKMASYSTPLKTNYVWCEGKQKPFDLPIFPVEFNKNMRRSVFKDDFEKERKMAIMDTLNVYYVAFTRAVENLFIFAPNIDKESADVPYFESLLRNCLDTKDDLSYEVGCLCDFKEQVKDKQFFNPFEYGLGKELPIHFDVREEMFGNTTFFQSNLSLKFDYGKAELSNNQFVEEGIIMHNLFSRIETVADIDSAVCRLIFDGTISAGKKDFYCDFIKNALADKRIKDWFTGEYEVLNERSILKKYHQDKVKQYRPDRIMTKGKRAIVVDYKFGTPFSEHKEQIQKYVSLLQEMGYNDVEGYLWYVKAQNIVSV